MTVRIPKLLEAILGATADKTAAEVKIKGLREVLTDEAKTRLATEGAAPTWKARGFGTVRYDEAGEWTAQVSDTSAFGSYVAERHPTEAITTITVDARKLEDALAALEFAGITPTATMVEVREPFRTSLLESLLVDVEETEHDDGHVEREFTITTAQGEIVPGVHGARSAPKLVVSLDRDAKRSALEVAQAEADELVANATVLDDDDAVKAIEEEATAAVAAHQAEAPHGSPTTMSAGEAMAVAGKREAALAALSEEQAATVVEPAELSVGASALARHKAYEAELAAKRAAAEGRADVVAAATPVDAPVAPSSSDATPGDDNPAVLAMEAAGNREQLRALARRKGLAPGGTKRDVALALVAAGATADEVGAA